MSPQSACPAQAAKSVSCELLTVLRGMPLIPDKYVFDNPFITGGADAKLGDDRAAACFRIAYAGIKMASLFQHLISRITFVHP